MASPTGSGAPQSIEPASSAKSISISRTPASSAQTTTQSTDSAVSSRISFSRSSQRTSTAVPGATDISIIPALGKPAPRDCPASNGTEFIATSPFDHSEFGSGTTIVYEKICASDMEAKNKKNLASFVVNSFDLCIQTCAGQKSSMPVSATYHWADGAKDPKDGQRPGTCWCCVGNEPIIIESDNNDLAIPKRS